jgi:spectinomycin phosphotransferase
VAPDEEAAFFAGYGPVTIDPAAIIYYRYERFAEDLGDVGLNVFRNPEMSEAMREDAAELARSYFAPGGYLETVETVSLERARGGGVER